MLFLFFHSCPLESLCFVLFVLFFGQSGFYIIYKNTGLTLIQTENCKEKSNKVVKLCIPNTPASEMILEILSAVRNEFKLLFFFLQKDKNQ